MHQRQGHASSLVSSSGDDAGLQATELTAGQLPGTEEASEAGLQPTPSLSLPQQHFSQTFHV